MPRNNRNTTKSHHRAQRPKWARNPLSVLNEAERSTLSRVINARPEQVGSLRLMVGIVLAVVGFTFGAVIALAQSADARVTLIDGPHREVMHHNWVVYHEHVPHSNEFNVVLRDASTWVATACRTRHQHNCWWNHGRKFMDLSGHNHYVRPHHA